MKRTTWYISCASSDAGSEWSFPDVSPRQCFPYVFRSDFEAATLMNQIYDLHQDSGDLISTCTTSQKDDIIVQEFQLDCCSLASSGSSKVPEKDEEEPMPIISLSNNNCDDDDGDENSSDSDSLESLSSSEDCSLESMDESEESDGSNDESDVSISDSARGNPILKEFGNHALLQYHFQNVHSSSTRSDETEPPTHGSSTPNQSQQIRKRRRTSSESSTDEEVPSAKRRSLEVSFTQTKRIDLSTTEKQNNTVERWHKNNKSFWWKYLAGRLGWSCRALRNRLDELVKQGRIDASHISANFVCKIRRLVDPETEEQKDQYILNRVASALQRKRNHRIAWSSIGKRINCTGSEVRERYKRLTTPEQYALAVRTERTTTKDLSSTESQNNYLIQTVQHWQEKNHRFSWRTLYDRLGLSSEEVRRRVYELVEQGKIDSTLVPPQSNKTTRKLVLDTVEKQDQYILDQVNKARLSNRQIQWTHMAKKLDWHCKAIRERYFLLMDDQSSATIAQDDIVSTPDTACTEPEVIDLTDIPENGTTSSDSVTLQSPNLNLLQRQNSLSTLWRQLGVEFGVREAVFEELWQRSLHSLYIRDYSAAFVPEYPAPPPLPLSLNHQQCTWLCAQVYAWRGRGRGLWEGLSRVLKAPPVQVMCHWSMLTPVEVQHRWVEEAVNHSMQKARVLSNSAQSSTDLSPTNTTSSGAGLGKSSANSNNRQIPTNSTSVSDPRADKNVYLSAQQEPLSHAQQVRISQRVYKYYMKTTCTLSVRYFWRSLSYNAAEVLSKSWKQLCVLNPSSDLFIPVVSASEVRAFTPSMDAQLIDYIRTMNTRWGKIYWPVIAHGLSSTVDVLRARWFCFIVPDSQRMLQLFGNEKGPRVAKASENASVMEIHNLVFDMVNTVSIVANIYPKVLANIRHDSSTSVSNSNTIPPTTISISHTARLTDAEIAVIIAAITAWNRGDSIATSVSNLWTDIAEQLNRKFSANELNNWWRKLCRYNEGSQLIVWPVANPATKEYTVSTIVHSLSVDSTQTEFVRTLEQVSIKNRWLQDLSQRPAKVYQVLHEPRKDKYDHMKSSLFIVDMCMDEMIRAVELTHRVDAYLNPTTTFSDDTTPLTHSMAVSPILVKSVEVSPLQVWYTSSEIRTYLVYYIYWRASVGHAVCWRYLANRLKTDETTLRQIYEDLLRRKDQAKTQQKCRRQQKPKAATSAPAQAPAPVPAREPAPARAIKLDPQMVRWHEERVKSVASPARTASQKKEQPSLSHSTGALQIKSHQHHHQQQQQQQQQQILSEPSSSHIDQIILHAVYTARDSGGNVDWDALSQKLKFTVPTLQSRFLYLRTKQ